MVVDRNHEVFRKYNFIIYNIYRTRGGFLLDTDCGLKICKTFDGNIGRIEFEADVNDHLYKMGHSNIDFFEKTQEGEIISRDKQGQMYYVKKWFRGDSCNLKDLEQTKFAAKNLASLHKSLKFVEIDSELPVKSKEELPLILKRRSRELKRILNYIMKKTNKNDFEITYINLFQEFHEQGLWAIEEIENLDYNEILEHALNEKMVCHGSYTYHNLIMAKPISSRDGFQDKIDLPMATTNFNKSYLGLQISDLYFLIRKSMEKNNWDMKFGKEIVEAYNKEKPITKDELNILYILLLFPEKFWKVSNFYMNNKKSWTSRRSIEKLIKVKQQDKNKQEFLESLRT